MLVTPSRATADGSGQLRRPRGGRSPAGKNSAWPLWAAGARRTCWICARSPTPSVMTSDSRWRRCPHPSCRPGIPPRPSSATSMDNVSPSMRRDRSALLAPPCLMTLVSASAAMKYAVLSTGAGRGAGLPVGAPTVEGNRSVSTLPSGSSCRPPSDQDRTEYIDPVATASAYRRKRNRRSARLRRPPDAGRDDIVHVGAVITECNVPFRGAVLEPRLRASRSVW
jgi:hypothetical protein